MFSGYNRIKIEINNGKIWKTPKYLKIKQYTLNNTRYHN